MLVKITPFTFTDYKNHPACVLWFGGCNMRCAYCYNAEIIFGKQNIAKDEIKAFLRSRINKLDGVVFSGGECTFSPVFFELVKMAKELGFLVKIDTNGTNFNAIKTLVNENLADFFALDFKGLEKKFELITATKLFSEFEKSFEFLLENSVNFELRTTFHSSLLDEKEIENMSIWAHNKGYKNTYFIQNFLNSAPSLNNLANSKSFDLNKINSPLKIEIRN